MLNFRIFVLHHQKLHLIVSLILTQKMCVPVLPGVVKCGAFDYQDGTRYVGDWNSKGQKHGMGHLVLPDGTRYDGAFNNGLCGGLGVMCFPDGAKYKTHTLPLFNSPGCFTGAYLHIIILYATLAIFRQLVLCMRCIGLQFEFDIWQVRGRVHAGLVPRPRRLLEVGRHEVRGRIPRGKNLGSR